MEALGGAGIGIEKPTWAGPAAGRLAAVGSIKSRWACYTGTIAGRRVFASIAYSAVLLRIVESGIGARIRKEKASGTASAGRRARLVRVETRGTCRAVLWRVVKSRIAAIVVGCLVVGPGILAIAYVVITRRRRPSHQDQADAMLETGPAYALTSSET